MSLQSSASNYKVYKHTCPNGKVYIGITKKNPLDRWKGGFGYETQVYFWRAIVKYGWINIKHEILFEDLTKEEAEAKEKELIRRYNSQDINHGYNIDLGCDHLQSKEARERMKQSKTGKKWSERQRIGYLEYVDRHVGRTVYKFDRSGSLLDTFKNVSLAAKDAGVPTETLRNYLKMYVPKKFEYVYTYSDKFHEAPHRDKNKHEYCKFAVDMYDMSLNYIRTFSSVTEATKFLGLKSAGHISDACKGYRLSSHGYIWRYHNENTDNKAA